MNKPLQGSRLTAIALLAVVGCAGRPSAVAPPSVDADAAAEQALSEYDRDGDAQLNTEELKACPSLADAAAVYDADKNGSLTQEEITAGIESWDQRGVGAITLSFAVRMDNRPLGDAQVKLIPEPFLGEEVKGAIGLTDGTGTGVFNMAPEDRPSNVPKNLPMIQPGLYRVEITHASVKVPAKYNTESILGLEAGIAGQNPAGVTWKLTSK